MPAGRNNNNSNSNSQRSRQKRPRADASSSNLAALPMTSTNKASARQQPSNDRDAEFSAAATSEQPTRAAAATNAETSSSTSSAAEDRILRLSEGCRQHRLVHAKRVDVLDEFSAIPEDCQLSLDSLSTILPRLEAEWGIVSSDSSALLPAVCDFYRSVLTGAFCPHAPHLFRLGRNGDQGAYTTSFLFRCHVQVIAPLVFSCVLLFSFSVSASASAALARDVPQGH